MLSKKYYELIARYTSDSDANFNEDELTTLYTILHLAKPEKPFRQALMKQYRSEVDAAVQQQNVTMTELCGEFGRINDEGNDIDAYRHIIEQLDKIASPFMLDVLVGALVGLQRPRTPL